MGDAQFTELFGDGEIDVASGSVCDIESTQVKDTDVTLSVTTAGASQVSMAFLELDALAGGAARRLKLIGGGKVNVDTATQIRAAPDDNQAAYIAKLWVAAGTFITEEFHMQGGLSNTRKVELDFDQDVTVTTRTTLADEFITGIAGGGWITVDVAANKVFDVGELVVEGPCRLKVTGSYTGGDTPGKLQTSNP